MHHQSSRQSTAGGSKRASLAPLRVKQENTGRTSSGSASSRLSLGAGTASGGSRLSAGARKSTSIKHGFLNTKRHSSGYGGRAYSHEILKDTRQLSNKSYIHQEIKDLLEFLTQQGYPHPINPKVLLSPTTKDFLKVFGFLYSFLETKYTPAQKFEEEIPQIFKTLRYPFNISKSSMFTVSTPHTWPNILGALHWLLNSVKYALAVDIPFMLFSGHTPDDQDDDIDSVTQSEFLLHYVEESYNEFLDGADTYEELTKLLAKNIRDNCLGETGNLDSLVNEERRLEAELQLLQQEPCHLTALQEQAQLMAGDNERFSEYLQELADHKRVQQQKLQSVELQLNQTDLELEQTTNENQRLSQQLSQQELSATDVQHIHAEIRQLNAALDAIERNKQEIDQDIWKDEKQIAKKHEQLEKQLAEFNSLARNLQLIPATAENAHGIDYELKLSCHSAHSGQASLKDFRETIKESLLQFKKQVNEERHKIDTQKLHEVQCLEQLADIEEGKVKDVGRQDGKLQRHITELENVKEKAKEEMSLLASQQGSLEQRLQQMRSLGEMDLARGQAELTELVARRTDRFTEMQQEDKEHEGFLTEACMMVVEHKSIIDGRVSDLDEQFSAMIDKLKCVELPASAPS